MARETATYELVAAAARNQNNPTVLSIRAEIGTGSYTTIGKHLAEWRRQQQQQGQDQPPQNPIAAVAHQFNRIQRDIAKHRHELQGRILTAITEQLQLLTDQREQARAELVRVTAERDRLRALLAQQTNPPKDPRPWWTRTPRPENRGLSSYQWVNSLKRMGVPESVIHAPSTAELFRQGIKPRAAADRLLEQP